MVSSVCCCCHLKYTKQNETEPTQEQCYLQTHVLIVFPSRHNTQVSSKPTHAFTPGMYRLQLRPSNFVTLIHRCVQLGMQVFMLRGCFEHTCCCHYFVHANNRERILEHEHLLWLRIALRFQLRPPKFCQWHLGLRFCGCSNMGIFASLWLGVGSAFVCVSGSACAEWAERGFRLVTSQIKNITKNIHIYIAVLC